MKSYITDNQEDKTPTKDALNSSLKHLDFILFFEIHLEQKLVVLGTF
jgi:hypothetical protein